ncbi:MSMEG_0569 family flavin-dependent oxidoreductase [Conexibacter sp. SYSU D00693]|uniref:MSMEG_0569 family flavin-dependent oxidoreductase n=1 Tax=Conexibacter sp. SYSU D00693 TaxID=2812560 RepID=UPI00196AE94F|nr:MSMEG_0569 family flavin-dependent oxidoreductase [Conexibacter sp. SYSU D00693]
MPEVHLVVRWPDGTAQRCTSPSTAIERFLAPAGRYPAEEFVRRATAGLDAAGERVRERYGFRCTAAEAQAEAIRDAAALHTEAPDATVVVESLKRAAGRRRFPAPERLGGHRPVVVVGAGQAGLAVSWHLKARGIDHVVLERDRIASNWRDQRWDAFCLVTPNWQCRLPGHPYAGPEPDGFMVKDDIVAYVEDYAASFAPPVLEGVAVDAVERRGDLFLVRTPRGELTADAVVLAVGGYHVAKVPPLASALPAHVAQVHSSQYRNADALPDGGVLVVGSGQSGAQIAEDLHLAGRQVHLCVGSAPRVARFHRGRDVVAWLEDMGHYEMPVDEHPEGTGARREPNHYVTGRDGGRDIDLRAFAAQGMALHGRLLGARGAVLQTGGDLRANLDAADATKRRIEETIDRWIAAQGIDAPPAVPYSPVWAPPASADAPGALDLDAAGVRTVVWATGFRSDWSWVRIPEAFDATGYPAHDRGVTRVPGLHVLGLPWLHTWGSGRFAAVGRDAAHLAERIAAALPAGAPVRVA